MTVFKCKCCGGNVIFNPGSTVGECDSCGTKQTLPKTEDDQITNLFNRANNLRMKCEFDKAEAIYEKIVEKDDSEAEAHWGIVLCKYGIEYVEDPKTGKRMPTCHRTLFDAVTADPDYQAAVDYAEAGSQSLYESEARAIDRIQKDILAIVKNEKPFDVFICYKETDENGKRTVDSTIANDIYYQLTQEGFKVFYAAITLEDKLGQEYEPYIFAALNSAKVMLVVGTKPEYFNAVWVKNEWSRYLRLMKTDRSKLLIPCYRDMDAYELPEEFAHLQAQDMSKIGFMQDLIRGIKKISADDTPKPAAAETVVVNTASANIAPLLKRAFMFLEDGSWKEADEYFEKVLDQDPENAQAYLGKLMAELKVKKQEDLKDCAQPFDGKNNYQKAVRFGNTELPQYIAQINERNELARLNGIYNNAKSCMAKANSESDYNSARMLFRSIPGFKDSDALANQCLEKAETCRIAAEKSAKKKKKIIAITSSIVAACIVFVIVLTTVIIPSIKYNAAIALMNDGKYEEAIVAFEAMDGYKDSVEQITECRYDAAVMLMNEGQYSEAIAVFESIDCYKDSADRLDECHYSNALALMREKKYQEAITAFEVIVGYKDSKAQIKSCQIALKNINYTDALALVGESKYEEAYTKFKNLNGYKDSTQKIDDIYERLKAQSLINANIGNIVVYGNYEQDNNVINGKEYIEWIVLSKEENKILVRKTMFGYGIRQSAGGLYLLQW